MRTHVHEEVIPGSVDAVFRLLHTPSAIRHWWSAARAVVVPEAGGLMAIAWGESEDDPDYATAADISVFEPPHRLVLHNYRYRAKSGGAQPGDYETEFTVTEHADGAVLRVSQSGFPEGPEGDAYLAGCAQGWTDTFAGIRRYLTLP